MSEPVITTLSDGTSAVDLVRAGSQPATTLAGGISTVALESPDPDGLVGATLAKAIRGAKGDKGDAAEDGFEQAFGAASAEWIINHSLGREPNVQVISPGGVEVDALVVHTSLNQARVLFNAPAAGRVRCY